jgi:hypothetical protein
MGQLMQDFQAAVLLENLLVPLFQLDIVVELGGVDPRQLFKKLFPVCHYFTMKTNELYRIS